MVRTDSTRAVTRRRAVVSDARDVSWWVLVGAGSGALAGVVVGGLGGRLAMLLLRLTSPDAVVGLTSDDGFEIGVVSTRTFELVSSMGVVGAVNGVLYAALRGAIPPRLRLVLWTALAAALGGAAIVHEDGVDFTLLEPAALAIVLFVLLPAGAAALVALLVERWVAVEAWSDTRLALCLGVAALAGTAALLFAGLVAAGAVVLRGAGVDRLVGRAARVAVPAALVVVTAVAAWELVTTSARIL
jgi:hypothetical protein